MGKQYEKKITWTVKNVSSLQSENIINSDHFVVGGCKWRLQAYPKKVWGDHYFTFCLSVDDSETLPYGWRRHTKFRLAVVNHYWPNSSKWQETQMWFDHKTPNSGYQEMLSLTKLLDTNAGFLVNGEVKIVAELGVLEVIGKSDVLEETSFVIENMDINGFQVTSPQVEYVNNLFIDHPNIASNFRPKNPLLRTTYMNVLLSLTEILCKSSKELSNGDLADAYSVFQYVTKAGFKLDWLENKMKEACETRLHGIKEELTGLKQKCADMEALVKLLR